MKKDLQKPDPAKVLCGLKDFQRATVEYVFRRLYTDADYTRRFLVADEVGLGKTLVARGVIAKTIEHLWDQTDRIDVIYVCSNTNIARQNINRLGLLGCNEFSLSSRITLLPLTVSELHGQRVNFISFTPGTSFDLKRSGGIAQERALLYWMLRDDWGLDQRISSRPFEGTSRTRRSFQYELDHVDPDKGNCKIHPEMQREFVNAVNKQPRLRKVYDELLREMPPRRSVPQELRSQCLAWIAELRRVLAKTCLHWLEPDLIILDEFQRFKHLMAGDSEDTTESAALAEELFSFQDGTTEARVLLLSATPYKMFTTSEESADDDHYEDFRLTLSFLISDPQRRHAFEQILARYRDELFHIADRGTEKLVEIKCELETMLRSVMVRTERLAIGNDRDGMLEHKLMPSVELQESDVRQYLGLQRIAGMLGHGDMLEYWKSAPYLMNFMEHYDVKHRLKDAIGTQADSSLTKAFRALASGLLSRETIEQYGRIDPGNARLRSLALDTVGRKAWQLLWIPPSLPYYQGDGAYSEPDLLSFTKRLVFSSWRVVPKAIASLLSYEAERQMMLQYHRNPRSDTHSRESIARLLQFNVRGGKPSAMTALAILYPGRTLAEAFDPKDMLKQEQATKSEMLAMAEKRIARLLQPVFDDVRSTGTRIDKDAVDDRWYWAAPLLLDLHHYRRPTQAWLKTPSLAEVWSGEALAGDGEAAEGWKKHVELFQTLAANPGDLGNPPDDLTTVLAEMAVAAPGTVSLRSLTRMVGQADQSAGSVDAASYAAPLAHAFLTLFNLPEVTSLVRDKEHDIPYWRSMLSYAIDGNIQSMLDEYLHFLVESLGLPGKPLETFSTQIVREAIDALSLRTTRSQADLFNCEGRRLKAEEPLRIRNRFAISFGDQTRDDDGEQTRLSQVRSAFNSPFWPFVLASTSVGQEGLDFHPYCHAVVHWNLPSNPVDLEQREGRVHRYKGHALRKNIASSCGDQATNESYADPWQAMFDHACANRPENQSDLYPFWISPGGEAKIERYMPFLPHSREVLQKLNLQRSLVLYRMVFGQNRQEDLINYLRNRFTETQISELIEICRIDLSPNSQHPILAEGALA